jgi:hypothetical protein
MLERSPYFKSLEKSPYFKSTELDRPTTDILSNSGTTERAGYQINIGGGGGGTNVIPTYNQPIYEAPKPYEAPTPYVAPKYDAPTPYTAPVYTAPIYNQGRVDELTATTAAPMIRGLRSAMQRVAGTSYDNPNVGRMTLREALAGYGQGMQSAISGAAITAKNLYNTEFGNEVDTAKTNYGAAADQAKTNYGAAAQTGLTNYQALVNQGMTNYGANVETGRTNYNAGVNAANLKYQGSLAAAMAQYQAMINDYMKSTYGTGTGKTPNVGVGGTRDEKKEPVNIPINAPPNPSLPYYNQPPTETPYDPYYGEPYNPEPTYDPRYFGE